MPPGTLYTLKKLPSLSCTQPTAWTAIPADTGCSGVGWPETPCFPKAGCSDPLFLPQVGSRFRRTPFILGWGLELLSLT